MPLHLRAWGGLQANGHELAGVGGIVLDDGPVRHPGGLQAALEGLEVILPGLEHNGVRARSQAAWGRFSGRVADLCCEDPAGEVRPDDDVVVEGVCRGGLTVNRSSWTYGNSCSGIVKGENERRVGESNPQAGKGCRVQAGWAHLCPDPPHQASSSVVQ